LTSALIAAAIAVPSRTLAMHHPSALLMVNGPARARV
jgi:hypothetical protein